MFYMQFLGVLQIVEKKLMTYLKSWWYTEPKTCKFYAKMSIWNFDILWSELDLASIINKVGRHHRVKYPSLSASTCEMTQKTCVTCRVCDLYFIVTFCDLTFTLIFQSMTLELTQYPSQIFTSTLWEFELLAAHLNDPRAQNVKTMFFDLWTDFDLTRRINLGILSMD